MISACGFAVGVLVGLTGMGGGSVMTALLILVFHVHPVTAVGTDLLFAAFTKLTGAAVHARNDNVDWRVVGVLAAGSVPATAATIWVLSGLAIDGPTLARTISLVIGIALVLAGIGILARPRLMQWARIDAASQPALSAKYAVAVVLGAILGVLVSLSSVGAGALGLAVLFFLFPHIPAARLVGSDIAHAVPLTLLAGFGHWYLGSIDWGLLAALLIGSIPGIYIGSHLANVVPERLLMPALACMLLFLGLRLLAT